MTDQRDTITVNGQPVEIEPGRLMIHVLREQGIEVPTLCHDDRLKPYGGCRLCVVERLDGRGGLFAACSMPAQAGMVVETDSDLVLESRRQQLQLLALNHRMECPVCDRHGDCRFQDLVFRYGTPEQALPFDLVRHPRDEVSQVISRDPEKCVLCGRCVRICEEVQGIAAIGMMHRGLEAKVGTLLERQLDCEFCGQCVNDCPVGALVARPHVGQAPAHLRHAGNTTCGYCSCGCQLRCEVYEGRIERVGLDETSIPNHGKLCAKGWLGQDVHNSDERLTTPLIRRDGELVETSWDEALDAAAKALAAARESDRAIVGLGSARMSTEDAYQMQYFMRAVLGSPHACVGAVGGRSGLINGLAPATGRPRSTAGFEDLASADLAVVLRADPSRTHPLVKTELVQRLLQRDQQVVLAASVTGGLERHVTSHLPLVPGTEAALLAGVGRRLLETVDAPAGFEDWSRGVADHTPERVGEITGLAPAAIEELAAAIARARSVVFVVVCSVGIPGSEAEVAGLAATLVSLLPPTEGQRSGVLLLGEKANTQGVLDAGLDRKFLPGARSVDDAQARAAVEAVWGMAPPAEKGWAISETMTRADDGEVGLLYLVGQNPETVWHHREQARSMIENAGFVIAQDAFLTEAAAMADIVLPVAILAERNGTLVGADGVTRPLQHLLDSPGNAPQDGRIFAELARRIGSNVPEDDELAAHLEALVWTPADAGPAAPHVPSPPQATSHPPEGGLLFDITPQLFHSGSMTRHSEQLSSLSPFDILRIAPADAARIGIEPGQKVRVAAGGREVLLRARIDKTVRPGTVASIWNDGEEGVGDLFENLDRPVTVEIGRTE